MTDAPIYLSDAKDALLAAVKRGESARCLCCNRLAKVYRRKMHATMGKFLCDLARTTFEKEREWIHVNELRPENGNYGMLRLWELARPANRRSGHANAHGLWSITPEGLRFAKGASKIKERVILFNGSPIGFDGEDVGIETVLGTRFSYAELMAGVK